MITSSDTEYAMGVPTVGVPGFQYKLCWAHDPQGVSDYKVAESVKALTVSRRSVGTVTGA